MILHGKGQPDACQAFLEKALSPAVQVLVDLPGFREEGILDHGRAIARKLCGEDSHQALRQHLKPVFKSEQASSIILCDRADVWLVISWISGLGELGEVSAILPQRTSLCFAPNGYGKTAKV
jgi:hypothetical protein